MDRLAVDAHRAIGIGNDRRITPLDVGGQRDHAAIRILATDPAPDALEDEARRRGDFEQHAGRRRHEIDFGLGEPALDRARGTPRPLFDAGLLEDDVGRLERGVGDGIGHLRPHAGDAVERPRERLVVAHEDAALRERRDAAQDAEHEHEPRRAARLAGEQSEQRAPQRVGGLQVGHAVVGQRRLHEAEIVLVDSRTLGFDAPDVHAKPRAIRRPGLPGDRRGRRSDREHLDVGEGRQLVADLGELAQEAVGDRLGNSPPRGTPRGIPTDRD